MTAEEIKVLQDKLAATEAVNASLKKENETLKAATVESADVIKELNEQLTAQELKSKNKFAQVKIGKDTYEIRAGKVKIPSGMQKEFGVAAELKDSELALKENAQLVAHLAKKQVGYLVKIEA